MPPLVAAITRITPMRPHVDISAMIRVVTYVNLPPHFAPVERSLISARVTTTLPVPLDIAAFTIHSIPVRLLSVSTVSVLGNSYVQI